jgi:hypothetical protein
MEEIKNLENLGLVLPSPLYIAGAILFGIVGLMTFRRGRKITSKAMIWTSSVFNVNEEYRSVLGVCLNMAFRLNGKSHTH